ncbi:MAG: hypothetical protein J6B12_04195 [Clostridia bacterium]|nr:hypothetical protein [Clostridia bacterium]
MGFGLLFIGYFIATLMSLHSYGWVVQIIGYYIVFRALLKLSEYKHSMMRCMLPLVIMTVCQILSGIHSFGFLDAMTGNIFTILQHFQIENLINTVSLAFVIMFHFLLLHSIRELAKDVEDPLIVHLTTRNAVIVGIYFLLDLVVILLPDGNFTKILFLVTLLGSIVYPIFMLYLFFRCYARICAPEDKDMEQKPSRFAFINKRREMRKGADKKMDELIEKLDKDNDPNKK